ncbi:MAG: hypothetical protein DWQ01_19785 [Planctomycetota bacterium]|nr:MAG: hypothetical protein DWQ01_19785 [Planctomycetota bacterium]
MFTFDSKEQISGPTGEKIYGTLIDISIDDLQSISNKDVWGSIQVNIATGSMTHTETRGWVRLFHEYPWIPNTAGNLEK